MISDLLDLLWGFLNFWFSRYFSEDWWISFRRENFISFFAGQSAQHRRVGWPDGSVRAPVKRRGHQTGSSSRSSARDVSLDLKHHRITHVRYIREKNRRIHLSYTIYISSWPWRCNIRSIVCCSTTHTFLFWKFNLFPRYQLVCVSV